MNVHVPDGCLNSVQVSHFSQSIRHNMLKLTGDMTDRPYLKVESHLRSLTCMYLTNCQPSAKYGVQQRHAIFPEFCELPACIYL